MLQRLCLLYLMPMSMYRHMLGCAHMPAQTSVHSHTQVKVSRIHCTQTLAHATRFCNALACVCVCGGGGNVAEQSSVHAGRYVSRNSATVVRIFVIVVEDVPQLVSCTWPLVNVRICTSVYVMLSFTQCVCAQLDELSFA